MRYHILKVNMLYLSKTTFTSICEIRFNLSVGFCRGSRVEGKISRVKIIFFFVRSISRFSQITD